MPFESVEGATHQSTKIEGEPLADVREDTYSEKGKKAPGDHNSMIQREDTSTNVLPDLEIDCDPQNMDGQTEIHHSETIDNGEARNDFPKKEDAQIKNEEMKELNPRTGDSTGEVRDRHGNDQQELNGSDLSGGRDGAPAEKNGKDSIKEPKQGDNSDEQVEGSATGNGVGSDSFSNPPLRGDDINDLSPSQVQERSRESDEDPSKELNPGQNGNPARNEHGSKERGNGANTVEESQQQSILEKMKEKINQK